MSLFDDLPEPSTASSVIGQNVTDTSAQLISESQHSSAFKHNADVKRIASTICSIIHRKGERAEMQDAHISLDDLRKCVRVPFTDELYRLSYFAVFDGHGGRRASEFAAKRLHLHLAARFPRSGLTQIEKDIKRVLYDAYKKTDEEFLRLASQQRPHWRDGSTASTVLFVNDTLYIANLGDSKVVLARESDAVSSPTPDGPDSISATTEPAACKLNAICLTRDHNPFDYEERQRIQAAGGNVQNGRLNNMLEVSRSFGDYQFKKQGVSCIPDVRKCQITPNDRFLLIACDGLWKSFPPNEAVKLTNQLLVKELKNTPVERKTQDDQTAAVALTERHVDSVCTYLVNEAVLRMSGDNVTCILIVFPEAYQTVSDSLLTQSGKLGGDNLSEHPVAKMRKLDEK